MLQDSYDDGGAVPLMVVRNCHSDKIPFDLFGPSSEWFGGKKNPAIQCLSFALTFAFRLKNLFGSVAAQKTNHGNLSAIQIGLNRNVVSIVTCIFFNSCSFLLYFDCLWNENKSWVDMKFRFRQNEYSNEWLKPQVVHVAHFNFEMSSASSFVLSLSLSFSITISRSLSHSLTFSLFLFSLSLILALSLSHSLSIILSLSFSLSLILSLRGAFNVAAAT